MTRWQFRRTSRLFIYWENIYPLEHSTENDTELLVLFVCKGKCSHGGAGDQTSKIEPKGGINKDSFDASHGHLHPDAANLAIAATSWLLEDIRGAAGDGPFLQYETLSACVSCFKEVKGVSSSHSFVSFPPSGCWESPKDPVKRFVLWSTPRKAWATTSKPCGPSPPP